MRQAARRKRILIVNVFFDDSRRASGTPRKVPQAMGPAYLAGAFARERCEVRLYNEQTRGALRDLDLLCWPDMLVLTGLTAGFDRMLHLTAYARALNSNVIVVAGGPAIRALPRYAQRFFDYACTGDVEELQRVARETLGSPYVAEEMFPRFDLVHGLGRIGYVESSRYCNFRCSFCALTGEGRPYQRYDLNYIRRQILAIGRRQTVLFIDNNFYGNDRDFFAARLALLTDLRARGELGEWSALVTGDFFLDPSNLARVRAAGCHALFSGVESFDAATLVAYNKRQNTRLPQVEMIRGCLEAGIMFLYGIMLDVTRRRLADLRHELDFIIAEPRITLPSFVTLTIPLLGTPYFHDCVAEQRFLPNVRLRDLDGLTVTLRPRDPVPEVTRFLHEVATMRGRRRQIVGHGLAFWYRYRRILGAAPMQVALANAAVLAWPRLVAAGLLVRMPRRTYVAGTEPLDLQYTPLTALPARFEGHFAPTTVTDHAGALTEQLAEDLLAPGRAPVGATNYAPGA